MCVPEIYIGPKWAARFDVFYDIQDEEFESGSIILSRDLHDAVINFEIEVDEDIFDEDEEDEDEELIDNISFKVSLSFKLPDQDMLEAQPLQSAFQSNRQLEES